MEFVFGLKKIYYSVPTTVKMLNT